MTADEGQCSVRVIECRLMPDRFLMADFALSPELSFVRIIHIVACVASRLQSHPLFIDVAGLTLYARVCADEWVLRQFVIDGYGLPIHSEMALIAHRA